MGGEEESCSSPDMTPAGGATPSGGDLDMSNGEHSNCDINNLLDMDTNQIQSSSAFSESLTLYSGDNSYNDASTTFKFHYPSPSSGYQSQNMSSGSQNMSSASHDMSSVYSSPGGSSGLGYDTPSPGFHGSYQVSAGSSPYQESPTRSRSSYSQEISPSSSRYQHRVGASPVRPVPRLSSKSGNSTPGSPYQGHVRGHHATQIHSGSNQFSPVQNGSHHNLPGHPVEGHPYSPRPIGMHHNFPGHHQHQPQYQHQQHQFHPPSPHGGHQYPQGQKGHYPPGQNSHYQPGHNGSYHYGQPHVNGGHPYHGGQASHWPHHAMSNFPRRRVQEQWTTHPSHVKSNGDNGGFQNAWLNFVQNQKETNSKEESEGAPKKRKYAKRTDSPRKVMKKMIQVGYRSRF